MDVQGLAAIRSLPNFRVGQLDPACLSTQKFVCLRQSKRYVQRHVLLLLRSENPRASPALPFYIGKGVGTRSHDHLVKPDGTRKGLKIKEIEAAGAKLLVNRLVDLLNEYQAVKLEAELIAAFRTLDTGAMLTNSVLPAGLSTKARASVVVPSGVKEKA